MTAVIFAGPTLPARAIQDRLDCIVLPPAAQGDVWRALRRHAPHTIGLIDGVFRGTRAVWHREILAALSEGVHVLGAASMGALRAAELYPFGMRGIGPVFDAYRTATWPGDPAPFEDDDEVAIEHAPAELGHAPLSTAMVDIRATLDAAAAAGAIAPADHQRLFAAMKALPYPHRQLDAALIPAIVETDRHIKPSPAGGRGLGEGGSHTAARPADHPPPGPLPPAGEGELQITIATLSRFHVPRKQLDALALVDAVAALAGAPPFTPAFHFERTEIWNRFVAEEADRDPDTAAVLDHLRRDPAAWRQACLAAWGWHATTPAPPELRAALSTFRLARGLARRADLDAWLADNALDEAGLLRLLAASPDRTVPEPPAAALAAMLRATGQFDALHRAARR